jgi:hypothetical protein
MIKRHLAGLIVAAVVAGSGVAAVAAAPGDDTNAAPARPSKEQVKACREAHQAGQEPTDECKQLRQNAARRGPKAGRGNVLLGHAVHGDLIVKNKDGDFENVSFDKGVVQAKGDKTLTLKREDGKTVTLKLNDDTKYRGVEGFDAVQTDRPAIVVSAEGTARSVAQRAPGGNNRRRGNVKANEEQVPAT